MSNFYLPYFVKYDENEDGTLYLGFDTTMNQYVA